MSSQSSVKSTVTDEMLAPHITWWLGVKRRYACCMWKLAVLTFLSVKGNGFWVFLEQSNL
jgi:hypothetical protein